MSYLRRYSLFPWSKEGAHPHQASRSDDFGICFCLTLFWGCHMPLRIPQHFHLPLRSTRGRFTGRREAGQGVWFCLHEWTSFALLTLHWFLAPSLPNPRRAFLQDEGIPDCLMGFFLWREKLGRWGIEIVNDGEGLSEKTAHWQLGARDLIFFYLILEKFWKT